MRKPITVAAACCCLAFAAAGEAGAATLSVDAKNSCLDLTTGTLFGAPAFLMLPNGKYTASMTSTATLGASGGALDKVYFYLQTPNRPFSSLNIRVLRERRLSISSGGGTTGGTGRWGCGASGAGLRSTSRTAS